MTVIEGVEIRLREERDNLGLSQTEFGRLMGVSRGTQKNYELGTAIGALDLTYLKALNANGVDATYVLTGQRTLTNRVDAEQLVKDVPGAECIGLRLKDERARLNLSQEDLAHAGGVNRNTQGSYERGVRNPDTAYLLGVARLGVDSVYVLTGQKILNGRLSETEADVITQYRLITDEDKHTLCRILKAFADDPGRT